MTTKRRVIGCDLGTTNTVVAIVDGATPRVLDNKEGRSQTRSAVSMRTRKGKEPEILVGDVALNNWPMAPKDTILSVKRLMGRSVTDPAVEEVRHNYDYEIVAPSDGTRDSIRVVMGGRQYSPVDISAMILRKAKEDAEYRLGEEVTDVVITVPAYFSQVQKAATRDAGLKAGLRVLKILDEPTAAAYAFGLDALDTKEPQRILVYDLGGGTFDISVLVWYKGTPAQLDLEGNMWLGGDNFDQVIVNRVLEHVRKEYGCDPRSDARFMAAMRREVQQAKERLSSANSADIIVANLLKDAHGNLINVEMEITRSEFESMVKPLVDETVALTEKALKNAQLTVEDINYVLMAGNATNVPLVQQAMEKMFGKEKVMRKVHPKNSVAMGAAKVGVLLSGKVACMAPDPADPKRECSFYNDWNAAVCERCGAPLPEAEIQPGQTGPVPVHIAVEVAPFSYGIQLRGDKYQVFISKNDPYPTEDPQPQIFPTRMPNQRMIAAPVYGGDNMERASANAKQGEAFAILPPGLPKNMPIVLKVWLNSDGIFALSASLEDGTDLKPWIVHGEADAKAMEALQKVDQQFEQMPKDLSQEEFDQVERLRNQAFEEMRRQNFEQAATLAEEFGKITSGRDPLIAKARNLIGFTEYVLHRYDWLLDANKAYQFNGLVEETKEAIEKGDRAGLERVVNRLDKATDGLPDRLWLLIRINNVIMGEIHPRDPVLAQSLAGELAEVEEAMRIGAPDAELRLLQLATKVKRAASGAGPAPAAPEVCSVCKRPFQQGDGFKCPQCGSPRDLLGDASAKTSHMKSG